MNEQELRKQGIKNKYLEKQKKKQRLIIRRIVLLGVVISISFIMGKVTNTGSRTTISEQPKEKKNTLQDEFVTYIPLKNKELGKGQLAVINNSQWISSYPEQDLINLMSFKSKSYKVKDKELRVHKDMVAALNQMLDDFEKEQGVNDLIIVSGYRSYEEQERVHYESLQGNGKEETDKYVAKPDRSEHHTGYAVDFGLYHKDGSSSSFEGQEQYAWIKNNCYKYGFILRYQSGKEEHTLIEEEPWHFRYVGQPHAALMKQMNFCLEEYIDYLKQYSYYYNPRQGVIVNEKGMDDAGKDYSIYYVPAEKETTYVPVPKKGKYTISGDNSGGYIVTICL